MKNNEENSNAGLFCSQPFINMEIHAGGKAYLCCPSWLPTVIGDVGSQSIREVWNGPQAQEIRRSILDQSFRYCDRKLCPFLKTAPNDMVKRIEGLAEGEMRTAIREKRTVLPHGPRNIGCSYDRSCNLSCPSCRVEIVVESGNKLRILDIQSKIKEEVLKDAYALYITGSGDPFGSPYFRDWLRSMRIEEMPNLSLIFLHSNGLLWSPEAWHSIPRQVRELVKKAEISIDAAAAETYSVNRRGGDFRKLLKNLEFIGSLREKGPLTSLTFSMVVQKNNFREMPAFVELGRRYNATEVSFTQITNWGTFSAEEFPALDVSSPAHPDHAELRRLLAEPIFRDPLVSLGNMTDDPRA
jgi:hypothetical protein